MNRKKKYTGSISLSAYRKFINDDPDLNGEMLTTINKVLNEIEREEKLFTLLSHSQNTLTQLALEHSRTFHEIPGSQRGFIQSVFRGCLFFVGEEKPVPVNADSQTMPL